MTVNGDGPSVVTLPRWLVIAILALVSTGFASVFKLAVDVQSTQVVMAYRLERIERQLAVPRLEEPGNMQGGGGRLAPDVNASPR